MVLIWAIVPRNFCHLTMIDFKVHISTPSERYINYVVYAVMMMFGDIDLGCFFRALRLTVAKLFSFNGISQKSTPKYGVHSHLIVRDPLIVCSSGHKYTIWGFWCKCLGTVHVEEVYFHDRQIRHYSVQWTSSTEEPPSSLLEIIFRR